MSEKRILIKEVVAPCDGCSGFGENVCDNCNDWDTWCSCLTREQAIEKMAKAIYEAMCPNFSQMFVGWRAYTKIAEAALNALLEANNGK